MQVLMRIIILVQSQQVLFENDDYNITSTINASRLEDSVVMNRFTELVYRRLTGATYDLVHSQIAERASFCITDP